MSHPIPVRRMNLDPIPMDEFNPVCIANNALFSYTFWGSSLYVALLEPFIVKSMRSVMDEIRDDDLRENVDRFSRQEAQHYQQHQRFNETLFAQGYPGLQQRYDRLKLDFARMTSEESDRYCVGFVEGFEAYTTQSALLILKSGLLKHPRTDARVGDLMSWHLMEEIEHRTIAFDIYQHLYGSYPYRAYMCVVAQNHIIGFINDCTKLMSNYDVERFGNTCKVGLPLKLLSKMSRVLLTIRSCLPWYTPHSYRIPDDIQALSDHYSAMAQSVS